MIPSCVKVFASLLPSSLTYGVRQSLCNLLPTSLSRIIFRHVPLSNLHSDDKKLYIWYALELEKAMAPHSSTLAWKIPQMEEPGWLQSMGVTKSRTWLSDFTFSFRFHALEKEMATHSSVLAWRTPGMGEPGGLPSMGSTESDTTEVT